MFAKLAVLLLLSLIGVPEPGAIPAGVYTISAYSYNEGGGENYFTAGGYTPVPYYTVAAGEQFDLGTVLYIEGVGEVQVQDRGDFPDTWIDLHVGYDDPEEWGLQEREVWIIE